MFYSIYDNGAKAARVSFAATEAIEGLDTRSVWFDPVNSLVTGDKDVYKRQRPRGTPVHWPCWRVWGMRLCDKAPGAQ